MFKTDPRCLIENSVYVMYYIIRGKLNVYSKFNAHFYEKVVGLNFNNIEFVSDYVKNTAFHIFGLKFNIRPSSKPTNFLALGLLRGPQYDG